ncbi:uncharacterized protein BP5553_00018 [Venustampulla echinocandica]|uniref:Uncharacterized protein n=1 Tax=Venustampulla echinocandica TaxID=2656787 RepID=A0A370TWZ4_9HELO|nr:uncharacterized protein BP5553_00018 [Venustampulla echinocandica]RDL40039.1 hypothetical protein BP5553_00018 [Venustampulla echinocandica]
MPPKGKPKKPTQRVSNSRQSITTAFKKLSEHLHKAQTTEGEIDCPEFVNTLKDSLKAKRQTSTKLESKFVTGLISILEQGQNDMCSRLGVPLFALVVETILQTDYCLKSERGLYLLAAALQQSNGNKAREQGLEKKQLLIGLRCLDSLVLYFVNISNHTKLRRWVGILCIQLLDGCEENCSRMELGPEESRRRIGQLITQETNEILRIICGRLIRVMHEYGTELGDLWPVTANQQVYQGFPETLGDSGWEQKFQNYIDDVFETLEEEDKPEATGDLYFGHKCCLIPSQLFGPPDHNVDMLVVGDEITIMTTPTESCQGEILDVALGSISHMKIILETCSQEQGNGDILFQLEKDHRLGCHLNGQPASLEGVYISTRLEMIKAMQETFPRICPELKISEEYHDLKSIIRGSGEELLEGAKLWSCCEAISLDRPEILETIESAGDRTLHGKPPISIPRTHGEQSPTEATSNPHRHQGEVEGVSTSTIYKQIHRSSADLYSASPPPTDTRHESQLTREMPDELTNPSDWKLQTEREQQAQKVIPKVRKNIRPKAKPPIQVPQVSRLRSRARISTEMESSKEMQKNNDSADAGALKMNVEINVCSAPSSTITESIEIKDSFEPESLWRLEEDDTSTPRGTTSPVTGARGNETQPNISYTQVQVQEPADSRSAVETFRGEKADQNLHTKQGPGHEPSDSAVYELPPEGDEDMSARPPKPITKTYSKKASKPPTASKSASKETGAKGKPQNQRREVAPKIAQITPGSLNTTRRSAPLERGPVSRTSRGKLVAKAAIVELDQGVQPSQVQNEKLVVSGVMQDNISKASNPTQIAAASPNVDKESLVASPMERTKARLHKGARQSTRNGGVELSTKLGDILDSIDPNHGEVVDTSRMPVALKSSKIRPQIKVDNTALPKDSQAGYELKQQETVRIPAKGTPVRQQPPPDVESCDLLDSKKRKAGVEEVMSPKKRRARLEPWIHEMEPLRHSPQLQKKSQKRLKEISKSKPPGPQKPDEEAKPKSGIKGRLLKPCPQHPEEEQRREGEEPSRQVLIDEGLHRKVPVISFDKKGPLNQGRPSNFRTSMKPSIAPVRSAEDSGEKKRKLEQIDIGDTNSLQRKRQSSPPAQGSDVDEYEQNDAPGVPSSPLNKVHDPTMNRTRQSRQPRTSSQAARVDINGSPHAPPSSGRVDHIAKAKQKLNDEEVVEVHGKDPALKVRGGRGSDIFGPRVRLQSQAKARPASPEKCEPRYIPHQKNKNGQYEELATNHIVQPLTALPDPFVGVTRTSSGFEDQLQRGFRRRERLGTEGGINNGYAVVLHDDLEKTLVDSAYGPMVVQSTPSSTSGSTFESHGSELSKTPLKDITPREMWNVALRPHYTRVTDAVHQIADASRYPLNAILPVADKEKEMIIQLSGEEDRIGLLVGQYKENGGRISNDAIEMRAQVKANMLNSLKAKKDSMIIAYAGAKDSIIKIKEDLKEQPVCAFEKDWQRKQDLVREEISGVRP